MWWEVIYYWTHLLLAKWLPVYNRKPEVDLHLTNAYICFPQKNLYVLFPSNVRYSMWTVMVTERKWPIMNLVTLNQTYECKKWKMQKWICTLKIWKTISSRASYSALSWLESETGCQAVMDGLWLSKKHCGVSQYADISTLYLNRSTLAISSQN